MRSPWRLVIVALAVAILAAPAEAATTRAEYVAQVDPICQAGKAREKAAIRSFKKRLKRLSEKNVDPAESKVAFRALVAFFNRNVRIKREVDRQIKAVIPATGDEETVSRWLQRRDNATDLLERATHAFAHGKERYASHLLSKASSVGFTSGFLVEDFGFKYCVGPDSFP
jgi:hypothetical protein